GVLPVGQAAVGARPGGAAGGAGGRPGVGGGVRSGDGDSMPGSGAVLKGIFLDLGDVWCEHRNSSRPSSARTGAAPCRLESLNEGKIAWLVMSQAFPACAASAGVPAVSVGAPAGHVKVKEVRGVARAAVGDISPGRGKFEPGCQNPTRKLLHL